jgi:hypothetical protein
MTVEEARYEYWLASSRLALMIRFREPTDKAARWVEATSIQLDLAVAEASARKSVAY